MNVAHFEPTLADPIDLNVGDLCVYIGNIDFDFCSLSPRVIYRVTNKEPSGNDGTFLSRWRFTFEAAFDMFPDSHCNENWRGTQLTKNGSRNVRKLTLLDLGRLRQEFDGFLSAWARKR